jgi:hypothetical protein
MPILTVTAKHIASQDRVRLEGYVTIGVDAVPGGGSTFWFKLPRAAVAAALAAATAAEPVSQP